MWRLREQGCFDTGGVFAFVRVSLQVCDRVLRDPQHWPLVSLLLLLLHFEREDAAIHVETGHPDSLYFLAVLSWPEIWCSDLQEEGS